MSSNSQNVTDQYPVKEIENNDALARKFDLAPQSNENQSSTGEESDNIDTF